MSRNKKVWPIHRIKKKLIESVPEKIQICDSIDKDFTSTVLNMFRTLKKAINKELKETTENILSIERTAIKRNCKKEPNRKSGVEKYNY